MAGTRRKPVALCNLRLKAWLVGKFSRWSAIGQLFPLNRHWVLLFRCMGQASAGPRWRDNRYSFVARTGQLHPFTFALDRLEMEVGSVGGGDRFHLRDQQARQA
jgi:hypothetical protein